MSSRTPNINLEKPSSDENYSISVFNGNSDTIDTEMALRVKTADIINNLTSTATNKPLSAAQGKKLQDEKVAISSIVNNLTSTATNAPLSAAQGKALSDTIANFRNPSTGFVKTITQDLNTLKEAGMYYAQNCQNTPEGNGYIVVIPVSTSYVSHEFINYAGTRYQRVCNNGTWGAWQKLVTEDMLATKVTYSRVNISGSDKPTAIKAYLLTVPVGAIAVCAFWNGLSASYIWGNRFNENFVNAIVVDINGNAEYVYNYAMVIGMSADSK